MPEFCNSESDVAEHLAANLAANVRQFPMVIRRLSLVEARRELMAHVARIDAAILRGDNSMSVYDTTPPDRPESLVSAVMNGGGAGWTRLEIWDNI